MGSVGKYRTFMEEAVPSGAGLLTSDFPLPTKYFFAQPVYPSRSARQAASFTDTAMISAARVISSREG